MRELKVKNVNHGGYCKHRGGVVCVTCDNNSKHNVRPRVGYDNVTTGKGGGGLRSTKIEMDR